MTRHVSITIPLFAHTRSTEKTNFLKHPFNVPLFLFLFSFHFISTYLLFFFAKVWLKYSQKPLEVFDMVLTSI